MSSERWVGRRSPREPGPTGNEVGSGVMRSLTADLEYCMPELFCGILGRQLFTDLYPDCWLMEKADRHLRQLPCRGVPDHHGDVHT
jgi:hypothetical protein